MSTTWLSRAVTFAPAAPIFTLRAVKMSQRDGVVVYAICDDTMIMLYEPAHSLFDLRRRFAVGRKTA